MQDNDSGIRWIEAASLFTAVGWGAREPEHLREAFARSTFKCFAFDDAKLVGFGRTIDDGRYYATLVDRIVHLDYQRQGIGSQIMQNLQNAMQECDAYQ
jgi:ribosomal protein S18 acetylase RimI-like enzyme